MLCACLMSHACLTACVARSTAYATRRRYLEGGLQAIATVAGGRRRRKVTDALCARLIELVEDNPQQYGWARSRWSSELLAEQLEQEGLGRLHASTVRRLLGQLDIVYRRPAPYITRTDPQKQEKLAAIEQLLADLPADEVAVFEDEVDINLLPKMGPQWTRKRVQPQVPTPGQNEKAYLAGALNAKTGAVHCVEGAHKDSALFFALLQALVAAYPEARRIHVIADNFIIHKSQRLAKLMRKAGLGDRINLVFLPTYSPKYNRIERLWKCLHDTVTRNHRCRNLAELMTAVRAFIVAASPFPGSAHALARLETQPA